ncbi:uncharacterized protein A4U43_C09F8510 [Asparagus officinalis]|uniref:Uncharacterized protein n=1 Tax=Asparagus officinalis TaxID=4686 RepID=A0A5P1E6N8_ASPOF|nr:uncharacterized protein A4U43_C09F8510 [Asparagus officinalis]
MEANVSQQTFQHSPPQTFQPNSVATPPVVGEGSSASLAEVLYLGVKIKITRESWEKLSSVLPHAAAKDVPPSIGAQADPIIPISTSDSTDKDSSSEPPPGFAKSRKLSRKKPSSHYLKVLFM